MTFEGILFICILNIRACFEFRLPARSPAMRGEGRDFVLRILGVTDASMGNGH
jgi:hypothetical protein